MCSCIYISENVVISFSKYHVGSECEQSKLRASFTALVGGWPGPKVTSLPIRGCLQAPSQNWYITYVSPHEWKAFSSTLVNSSLRCLKSKLANAVIGQLGSSEMSSSKLNLFIRSENFASKKHFFFANKIFWHLNYMRVGKMENLER